MSELERARFWRDAWGAIYSIRIALRRSTYGAHRHEKAAAARFREALS